MEQEVIAAESDREIIERTIRLARNTMKANAAMDERYRDTRPTITIPAHLAERLALLAQQTLAVKPANEPAPQKDAAPPG